MSLSKTREKRSNAGNRMSKLLDAEDEDDFYKTTYGGFAEVCYLSFKYRVKYIN
jgi:vacuolar protein sorting-associated protein 72